MRRTLVLLVSVTAAAAAGLPESQIAQANFGVPTAQRRSVLLAAACTAASSVLRQPATATAAISRDKAIDEVLSRVPAYVVCNSEGSPYLTNSDALGRRSGFVYLGPRDAEPVLREVRQYDPQATLAVLPLSSVYSQVAKNAADAERARIVVPQPKTSTSTDMRLFQLRTLSDEAANSEAVSMIPGATLTPGVTLFYEPDLLLGGADPATQLRPYFFRLQDLNMVWRQGNGDDRNVGRVSPSLRVLSLEGLLRAVEAGEADVQPLLMPPSETADLQYRAQ